MNRLNNGLMSLIDIHYLLENEDKSQLLEQSKKYNLEKICEHMLMLYEMNKSMDSSNSKDTPLLRNSNSLIHAGEKLVPFKTNIVVIFLTDNNLGFMLLIIVTSNLF